MTDATDRPAEVVLTSSQQASIRALLHDETPIAAPVWLARPCRRFIRARSCLGTSGRPSSARTPAT